jgi:hypothetical protein
VSGEADDTSSPDTWSEQDRRDFQLHGVCRCGKLRREHVHDRRCRHLTDVIAQCDV